MNEKKFKLEEAVYVVVARDGGYYLAKGYILGARKFDTSSSTLVYLVESKIYRDYYFPSDIYHSIEEFMAEAKNHVIE